MGNLYLFIQKGMSNYLYDMYKPVLLHYLSKRVTKTAKPAPTDVVYLHIFWQKISAYEWALGECIKQQDLFEMFLWTNGYIHC